MPNEGNIGLLSIAKKAGRLQTGEESVCALLREKRARLTLLAKDAGESVARKIRFLAQDTPQPVAELAIDKLTLGNAVGRPSCAAAAFTDVAFALAFARTLPEGAVSAEALADLEARTKRVKARRQSKQRS